MSDCDDARDGGVINIEHTQTKGFMKYWPTMIINKWDEKKSDFLFTFWGTKMVEVYGMELTGKYIKRGEFKESEQVFFKIHYEAMIEQRPVYLRTSIHWLNKDFQDFNAVVIPMDLRGSVKGTLALVVFDETPNAALT